MRTRYGISPWIDLFPKSRVPEFPRLRGAHRADVVIVGGGLTGCVTAYACALAGVKAIVVEADRIGQASAGRSAGLLLPDPGPAFRDIEHAHGLRAARTVFESWRRASLDAAALLRRLNIRCGLDPVTPLIAADRDHEKVLRREFDARSKAGIGATWLTQKLMKGLSIPETPAAIRMRDAFVLDPYRASLGLAAAATSRGAERWWPGRIPLGRRAKTPAAAEGEAITYNRLRAWRFDFEPIFNAFSRISPSIIEAYASDSSSGCRPRTRDDGCSRACAATACWSSCRNRAG